MNLNINTYRFRFGTYIVYFSLAYTVLSQDGTCTILPTLASTIRTRSVHNYISISRYEKRCARSTNTDVTRARSFTFGGKYYYYSVCVRALSDEFKVPLGAQSQRSKDIIFILSFFIVRASGGACESASSLLS